MSKLQIQISNFRAIQEARIDLNGITVLTGLNATGKSTIGRMMYYTGYYASHYSRLLDDYLNRRMGGISEYLKNYFNSLPEPVKFDLLVKGYVFSHKPFAEADAYVIIDELKAYYEGGAQVKSLDRERLGKVLGRQIKSRSSFFTGLRDLRALVEVTYKEYNKLIHERPPLYLRNRLNELFNTSNETLMKSLVVKEGTEEIISPNRKNIGVFSTFDSVFYIDTPMIANFPGELPSGILDQNWEELIRIFYDGSTRTLEPKEEEVVEKLAQITHGTIELPSKDQEGTMRTRKILFREADGQSYPLKEVATGIKSFALIHSLLLKGRLSKNTLLIIDEPEAHLHPQWVVEYARMITLLNRELGVRFLLATHSPKLVQTLYLLAEDEDQEEPTLKFYLSERSATDNPSAYRFRELTGEEGIEPIFACFNTAYDLMGTYVEE